MIARLLLTLFAVLALSLPGSALAAASLGAPQPPACVDFVITPTFTFSGTPHASHTHNITSSIFRAMEWDETDQSFGPSSANGLWVSINEDDTTNDGAAVFNWLGGDLLTAATTRLRFDYTVRYDISTASSPPAGSVSMWAVAIDDDCSPFLSGAGQQGGFRQAFYADAPATVTGTAVFDVPAGACFGLVTNSTDNPSINSHDIEWAQIEVHQVSTEDYPCRP